MTSRRSKQQRRGRANVRTETVQEIVGRNDTGTGYTVTASGLYTRTVDTTRPDYAFWDGLRHGTKSDYLLGGLFAEPIATILSSWVFGDDVGAKVDENRYISRGDINLTNELLAGFMTEHLGALQDSFQETLSLGDTYVINNPDGSLTVPSPSEVEILTTPKGSLNVTGYQLTTKLDTETIIDTYTLNERLVTVKTGGTEARTSYPNLIGAIPVTHIPTSKGTNELYGRPVYARLRRLFARYDSVLNKSLDGVELLGNPKPSIYGVEDPKKTIETMATDKRSVTMSNGKTIDQYSIDFSKVPFFVVGKGGRFEFVGPDAGFTGDSEKMLGILFLLMLQFSGVPEWTWGGAIASSKASVDSQLPAFVMLIKRLRRKLEKKIATIARHWLAYKAIYIPGVIVAPPKIQWSPVVSEDKEILLNYIRFAAEQGLIRDETKLSLTRLVENPAAEVEAAKQEAAEANPDAQVDDAINRALADDENDGDAA